MLTNIGKIIIRRLINCMDTMEILNKFESFWLEHDMSFISEHLLYKLGQFKGPRIISGTPVLVFKA